MDCIEYISVISSKKSGHRVYSHYISQGQQQTIFHRRYTNYKHAEKFAEDRAEQLDCHVIYLVEDDESGILLDY